MPSQANVETDDGSNTCWAVVEMWNSNLKKTKQTSFHWGASPTDANKAGVARFLPYVVQGGCWDADNIDGSKTEAGETYTGFANVLHGSASLMVTVEKLDGDSMYRLGKNSLKCLLKSRNLGTTGCHMSR